MAKAKKSETEETPKAPAAKKPAPAPVAPPAKKAAAPQSQAKTAAPKAAEVSAAPKKKPAAKKAPAPAAVAAAPAKAVTPAAHAAPKASTNGAPTSVVTREEYRTLEDNDRELPLEYGDTKVVLLVRDPEWIFAYWEMNQETRRKFGLIRGAHSRSLALRVYELDNPQRKEPYDMLVNDYTSSWYIRIPGQGSRFKVDLGIYDEKGKFLSISTSNIVEIPRMGISEHVDVEFAEINDEIYGQILHLSGGVRVSERLGSDEFLRSLQQRIFESLLGGPFSSAGISSAGLSSGSLSSFGFGSSSGLFSGQFSSAALSSAGLPVFRMPTAGGESTVQRVRAQKDDFWLEVGVDVIVYGATEPTAKVKFMGQEIKLNQDGTFRFRMVFPDTTIEFPVEATSEDGKHRRQVKPVVTRHTEGDPRKPA